MENLSKVKVQALLSFYNLFSEKLSLEECQTLSDTRYLLHSIVNFIETNNLSYQDYSNFGFEETVNYLRVVLDELITSQLNPKLADQDEDCFEIAKILVALFYELRLSKTKDVIEYVEELKPKFNAEIAFIISHLDNVNFWSNSPDSWAAILKHQPTVSNNNNTFNETINRTSPLSTPKSNTGFRGISNVLNSIQSAPPSKCITMKSVESTDENCFQLSPVSCVLNSPRGTELTKLKQQQRHIVELKERIKLLNMERDHIEESYERLKFKFNDANKTISQLESKVSVLKLKTEKSKFVEKELSEVSIEHSQLKARMEKLKLETDDHVSLRSQLRYEKDRALNQVDILTKENVSLKAFLDESRKKWRDEADMHNFTREKLVVAEREISNVELKRKKMIDEINEQLIAQEKNFNYRLQQKEDELRQNLELSTEVQNNYLNQISRLENDLQKTELKVNEFSYVKTELKTAKNEMSFLKANNESFKNKVDLLHIEFADLKNKLSVAESVNQKINNALVLSEEAYKALLNESHSLKEELSATKDILKNTEESNVHLKSVIVQKNLQLDDFKNNIKELVIKAEDLSVESARQKAKADCSSLMLNFHNVQGFQSSQNIVLSKLSSPSGVDDDFNCGTPSFYSAVSALSNHRVQSMGSLVSCGSSIEIYQEQEKIPLFQGSIELIDSLLKDSRIIEEGSPIRSQHRYLSSISGTTHHNYLRNSLRQLDNFDNISEQIDWSASSIKS